MKRNRERLAAFAVAESVLLAMPFLVSFTENRWHWVNDQGPSFLIALILVWGSIALAVLLPVVLLFMWIQSGK